MKINKIFRTQHCGDGVQGRVCVETNAATTACKAGPDRMIN